MFYVVLAMAVVLAATLVFVVVNLCLARRRALRAAKPASDASCQTQTPPAPPKNPGGEDTP